MGAGLRFGLVASVSGGGFGAGGFGVERREQIGGAAAVADFGEAGVVAVNGRKFVFGKVKHGEMMG